MIAVKPAPSSTPGVRVSRTKTLRFERSDLPIAPEADNLVPRILVADSSPEARARVADIVRNGEAVVDVAHSFEQVVALAARHTYAMLIVDKAIVGENLALALRRLAPRGDIVTAPTPV